MIDPLQYEDFEPYVGRGKVPPDPDGIPPDSEVTVPPLKGLKQKVTDLRPRQFVAINTPDRAKRRVAQRMDTVQYKVRKKHPARQFTVRTEWFGVLIERVK